ncbi:DUF3800 domain-containing protein [Kineobactrum salinum]|uniref:DUF3800 domain-containing protein n=1 Tax=Kineobactrum salinum TaxID=2708301 RepID=A0A6C0U490_9GAMM|nr:DUF3800 domain-containing protein [Kineobactrum salinum]QIB66970.1 DUF3800 domain-containing protein [Kineobactrum salinum]
MHLLYLDDSGAVDDPAQPFFVLAGASVFERRTHWIETRLNSIAARFDPARPHELELHGSPMRSGREGWKQFPLCDRLKAICDALTQGVVEQRQGVTLFGVAIKRGADLNGQDPVEYAFEQISNRFDRFLMRKYQENGDPQRGVIIFDKSTTERRIQTLARDFKHEGHTWGKTRNYAEVPLFLDSKSSRLIQLADLVAFALYRFQAHNDNSFYQIISRQFDSHSGVEHGLHVRY